MVAHILLAVLAAGERPTHDAFVAAPSFYSPGEALTPAARALFDTAYVSGFEPRRGVPTVLWAPPGQPRFRAAGLTAEQAARRYLYQWAPVYRFDPAVLADAKRTNVHDLGDGAVVVSFGREVNGLPVFMSAMHVVMTPALELVALTGQLPFAAAPLAFPLSADTAKDVAALDLTGARAAPPGATAKQGYYALPLRLVPAYQVELEAGGTPYCVIVSAEDGAVLSRFDRVASHSYRVWADATPPYQPWDGPGQDQTPHPDGQPTTFVPAMGVPPLISLLHSGISTNDPWLPVGAGFLEGNHAVAYADLFPPDGRNDPDAGLPMFADGGQPDGGLDPNGVPFRFSTDPRVPVSAPDTFDVPYDFNAEPTADGNRSAAGANAFFVANWMHDLFYDLGFDEKAGNAQQNNFARGGQGGDALRLELLDYGGRNNADMTTPPDGTSPRMQLFLWAQQGPQRILVNDGSDAGPIGAPMPYYAPTTPSWNVTGDLVEPVDVDGGFSGCVPQNLAAYEGKIVLANGSGCGDLVKIAHAADAGAKGMIVLRTGSVGYPAGSPPLPVHQVPLATATPWRATLAGAGTVNVTLDYGRALDRDSALDSSVVAHEWTHYLTNRLVGNGDGLVTGQSRGLGEGWSELVATVIALRAGDAQVPSNAGWNGTYATAGWTGGGTELTGVPNTNAYAGLGRYPYTADKTKNPLMFRHISKGVSPPLLPKQAHPSADASEVHATGEVWTEMLWECQVRLLRNGQYTVPQAQKKMLAYLVAALKATPLQPTFTEARDALLAVTRAASPAGDFPAFVEAFATRGLGLAAVAPPREAVGNAPLTEDTDTTGARWRVVAFDVRDVQAGGCDDDGILDSGEAGEATVTLMNVGAVALPASTLTLTASDPRLQMLGPAATIPATQPFATAVVKVPVQLKLDGAPGPSSAVFTAQIAAPALTHTATVRLNADRIASATEGFEAQPEDFYQPGGWIIGATIVNSPSVHLFRPLELTPLSHAVIGHDLAELGDSWLRSPPLLVGAGPFSFTFTHSYTFDVTTGTNYWDGGILEISTDGFNYTQIPGSAISPTYDNTIKTTANPLAGLPAFVGIRLTPVTVTVNLGTQYAGKTVYVRWRIGTDASIGATGWQIDDVAFTGLTNTPFTAVVPHRAMCGTNLPPVLTPPADLTGDERTTVMLVPRLTVDPNGDPVTVAYTQVSGPAAVIAGAQVTLPEVTATTTLMLRATASDGKGGNTTADFAITVRNVNRGPSVTATGPFNPVGKSSVTLTAAGTDPDGDALTFAWTQTGGTVVTLNGTTNVTFTAPDVTEATTLTFHLVATDPSGATAAADLPIQVVPKPVEMMEMPKPMQKSCGCGTTGAAPLLLGVALLLLRKRGWWLALFLTACGGPSMTVDAGGTGGGSGGGGGAGGGVVAHGGGSGAGGAGGGSVVVPDSGVLDAGHRSLLLTRAVFYSTAPDAGVLDNPPPGAVKVTCPLPDGGAEERFSETIALGVLRVNDVRDGACAVQSAAGGVVTAGSTIDFSARVVGRLGSPSIAAGTTANVTLTGTGYSPWVPTADDLGIVSVETGYASVQLVKAAASKPPAGATSATLTFNYASTAQALPGVNPTAGDQLIVQQLRTFTAPTTYRVPVAMGSGAAPAVMGAGPVSHAVTLQPVTLAPLDLDVDFADYVQQAPEVHPDANTTTASFSVQAHPAFAELGWLRGSPTGSAFTFSLFFANGPLLTGLYQVAPAPAGLTPVVLLSQSYTTSLQVPAAGATAFTVSHQRAVPLSAFTKSLPPALSPVRALKVNGVAASTGVVSGTGTRPRISWDAPRLGTPDAYQVTVFNTVVTAGSARFVQTSPMRTFDRVYTPPNGLITAGTPYLVVVRALKGAAWQKGDDVFATGPSEELAEAITSVLLP